MFISFLQRREHVHGELLCALFAVGTLLQLQIRSQRALLNQRVAQGFEAHNLRLRLCQRLLFQLHVR
ncbi:hypothetical protein SDC9_118591 [bioreactor metagenome]|uniref:Uncharacterized protein n=1 Tax=bioreactor metagenome TaxID=1076179 RepID=A0A645C827_9ZZZZ